MTTTPEQPSGIDSQDELRNMVADIACMFFGFSRIEYWKEAVASQHPDATDEAIKLINAHTKRAVTEALQSLNLEIIGFKTKDQVQGVLSNRIAQLTKDTEGDN